MRILTWNWSHRDFTRWFGLVEQLNADVAIIQESTRPKIKSPNVQWTRVADRYGIAVSVVGGLSIRRLGGDKPLHRCVHGYRISGPTSFNLLACWSHDPKRQDYRTPWKEGIAAYETQLKGKPLVIAGDFNDNSRWDRDYPEPCLESLLNRFCARHNLVSAYHQFRAQRHGKERQPTCFHLWDRTKPYHIDYVLVPKTWKLTEVSIGKPNRWLERSEHMPFLVTVSAN